MMHTTSAQTEPPSEPSRSVDTASPSPLTLRAIVGSMAGPLLLAAAYARVALTQLPSGVIGGRADGYENFWNDWWLREALLHLHKSPFFSNWIEYPTGTSLRFHTLDPFGGVLVLPFTALFGPIVASNLRVILALAATTFAAALLIRVVVRQPLAAFAGAAVYSYVNHEMVLNYLRGSANYLIGAALLPLYLLCLLHIGVHPRPLRWWAGGLVTLLALALTDWQYTLFAVVATVLYFVYAAVAWRNERAIIMLGVRLALLGGTWMALVFVPLVLPMLREIQAQPWLARNDQASAFGRSLSKFVDISAENPGYIVLLVTLVGFALRWRRTRAERHEERGDGAAATGFPRHRATDDLGFWAMLAVVATVLSLGPVLKLTPDVYTRIPLPYVLVQNLPLLSASRKVHLFFTALTMPAVSVFFAVAVREWLALLARVSRQRRVTSSGAQARRFRLPGGRRLAPGPVLTVVMLAAVLLPSLAEAGQAEIIPWQMPAFYRQLARDPDPYAILEVPTFGTVHGRSEGLYQAYQSVHHKYTFGSSIARDHKGERPDLFVKNATLFRDYYWLNKGTVTEPYRPATPDFLPTPQWGTYAVPLLNYYHVRYVVLYLDALRDSSPAAIGDVRNLVGQTLGGGIRPVYSDADTEVYRVPDAPPAATPLFLDTGNSGWYTAEQSPDGTWYRWADTHDGAGAELLIWNLTPQRRPVHIAGTLFTYKYKSDRTVSVAINGYPADHFTVASEGTHLLTLDLEISPGMNTLTFVSPEPPTPVQGAAGKDNRLLSFGLHALRLTLLP